MTGIGNEREAETKTGVIDYDEWLKAAAEAKTAGVSVSMYDTPEEIRSFIVQWKMLSFFAPALRATEAIIHELCGTVGTEPAYFQVLRDHDAKDPASLTAAVEIAFFQAEMAKGISEAERLQTAARRTDESLAELFPAPATTLLELAHSPTSPNTDLDAAVKCVRLALKRWPVAINGPKTGRRAKRNLKAFAYYMIPVAAAITGEIPPGTVTDWGGSTDWMDLYRAVWLTRYPDTPPEKFPGDRTAAKILASWRLHAGN